MKNLKLIFMCLILMGALLVQCKKPAAFQLKDQKTKVSYIIGYDIGKNMHKSHLELDYDTFLSGLQDAMAEKTSQITPEDQANIMKTFQEEMKKKQQAINEEVKKKNQDFLEENKKKEGIVVLPSGLQYKILTEGTGPLPTNKDRVKTNYTGKLIDGTVFDSTTGGEPAVFGVMQVIKGWQEALQLMPVGSKWELYIPFDLGYGPQGTGGQIGPYATLIFEMELLSIEK